MDRTDAFIARLGLPIHDREIIAQALTHASWLHEHPGEAAAHNERLEFLGDAVIGVIVAQELYRRHPTDDEGLLTPRRAAIVSSSGLARIASRLGVGDGLRLGEGEATREGPVRTSLLASGLEAVVGAVFLDLGWTAVAHWFSGIAELELGSSLAAAALKSPKSRLQEWTQQRSGARPEYRVLDAAGPDHEKVFQIEVMVDGVAIGTGVGSSRRIAETNAATEALRHLAAHERSTDQTAGDPS